MPGLLDEVMARAPATDAPSTMLMAAISLSAWMKLAPGTSAIRFAMYSMSSFWGVMG